MKLKELLKKEKNIKEFKYYFITVLIMAFSIINYEFLKSDMGISYIFIVSIIMVIFNLMVRIIDEIHIHVMLKDIKKNNEIQMQNTNKLAYDVNLISEDLNQITRLGTKYERRWKMLKWACKDSNNIQLVNYMENIEKYIDPIVDKEFDEMERDTKK